MTLDQLKVFIAVAEREHVTQAAEALGLAPPSVSAAVASLEREFQDRLENILVRHEPPLFLTRLHSE